MLPSEVQAPHPLISAVSLHCPELIPVSDHFPGKPAKHRAQDNILTEEQDISKWFLRCVPFYFYDWHWCKE